MGRMIDLTGRRFGRLLVIAKSERRAGSAVVWRCRCDCGREVEVPARDMLHRGVVSCGCWRRERAAANIGGDAHQKLGLVERTNVSRLTGTDPQRNNKSGYRGVSWRAVIYFQRRRFDLGMYNTPEEASAAYIKAKGHIHGDFVAWYNEHVKR